MLASLNGLPCLVRTCILFSWGNWRSRLSHHIGTRPRIVWKLHRVAYTHSSEVASPHKIWDNGLRINPRLHDPEYYTNSSTSGRSCKYYFLPVVPYAVGPYAPNDSLTLDWSSPLRASALKEAQERHAFSSIIIGRQESEKICPQ